MSFTTYSEMKARWFLPFHSLLANCRNSQNIREVRSGKISYSSSGFLFKPLVFLEAADGPTDMLLNAVLTMMKLPVDEPLITEILLNADVGFHDSK